ncbi:uncharacterized protein F5147DRAFT_654257 [Suillus discolor]|uniref:Uncharacterized protein n=1 Tax=Suillus discolor TaxID=1912936 RepID=A0A9P7F3I1_9AGAM|nr:uncharacterized protein F5147DRAFT_654257 [Suillus discolor]KAG2105072.1 hypothetical protein F5147DRAFT_654257 [Suillus discolor]
MDVDEGYADLEHQHQPLPQPNVDMEFIGPGDHLYRNYHTGLNARPCNMDGIFLLPGTPLPPLENVATDDWTPFHNHTEFETAEFLYTQNQMPAGQINRLLDLWVSTLAKHNDKPPFADHHDLYDVIDSSPFGDVNWQNFTVTYDGERPEDGTKPWMDDKYKVWFCDPCEVVCNMLANPTYASEIDYCPYQEYSTEGDKHQWKDFMSGDWAWDLLRRLMGLLSDDSSESTEAERGLALTERQGFLRQSRRCAGGAPPRGESSRAGAGVGRAGALDQADKIAKDPSTLGSTFVPVILGSDKTTVSVRTAHRDGVAVIGFLAMPKTTKEHATEALFHSSLSKILNTLKPGMTTPEVTRFGDGHYRRVIYGLGPYIADYEEQALLACIVHDVWHLARISTKMCYVIVTNTQKHSFKKIFSINSSKEHSRTTSSNGSRNTSDTCIQNERRIKLWMILIAGLRRFPQGHGFKQWTGDYSKALMKVYLPAIEGHVPIDVVRTFRALLEFCYLCYGETQNLRRSVQHQVKSIL